MLPAGQLTTFNGSSSSMISPFTQILAMAVRRRSCLPPEFAGPDLSRRIFEYVDPESAIDGSAYGVNLGPAI